MSQIRQERNEKKPREVGAKLSLIEDLPASRPEPSTKRDNHKETARHPAASHR